MLVPVPTHNNRFVLKVGIKALRPVIVALKGYDPVSYFPEGGGAALVGSSDLSVDYGGVTYNFANENNMNLFLDEVTASNNSNVPVKYEPTYGGWCAFAMASGNQVDIDPTLFDFTGDRLHFFVAQAALDLWLADKANLEKSADRRWSRILRRARR